MNKQNIGKRLKPMLCCPYCSYRATFATDRNTMLSWHYHIKNCAQEQRRKIEEVLKNV